MCSSASPTDSSFVLPKKRFCLEIFGGSCRLTREFERCGADALGIDWQHSLDEAEGKCISINLGTESGHILVWRILEAHCAEIELVALTPPCGTSSRAEDRCAAATTVAKRSVSGLSTLKYNATSRMYMQIGKSDVMAANVSFPSFCAEFAAEIGLKQRRRPSYVPNITI